MKKIVRIFMLVSVTVLIMIGLVGCSSQRTQNDNSSRNKITTTSTGDKGANTITNKKDNVKVEALGITANGDFAFRVVNDNSEPVYIESVNTIFKDSEGNFVDKVESEVQFFTIEGNSEVVNWDWGYNKDFSKYPNYEFELEFSESYMKNYFLTDNFEITANNTGEQITVSVKNNNESDIKTMQVAVVYYKDGNIVGCNYGYSDTTIGEGKTAYLKASYPEDSDYNKVPFDTYETYLLKASID